MGFTSVATTAGPVVAALSGMLLERYIVRLVADMENGTGSGSGRGGSSPGSDLAVGTPLPYWDPQTGVGPVTVADDNVF